ncbi:MAG: PAS domain S-box protein, partial [Methylobacter sp.]
NRFFEQRYGNAQRRRRYEYLFNRSGPCEVCETFKVLKSGARVDWKWTGPDGHDYEIHDFPFTDTDGSPMIMEVGIDVTEMNRAKQALHEANASLEQRVAKRTAELEVARQEAEQTRDLLQVTMDNAPALMSYVDAECRYRRVNKSYEQWFGHSHEQIYGHHMRDALGETVWQMITPYVERVLGGEQVAFEFSAPYLEGEPRWVYATYSPDIDAAGRVRGFVVHVLDTSERKRVEGALRESEQAFRSLAEAVPQIVWATRPDGWNIYFNQKWVDYTGLTLEESYGHGWNTPFHPDDKQRAWKAWQQATQFHESYSLECRLRRADGVYRWWLIRGMPMRDANGEIQKWFGTCTDIEDLKQAEEALREADQRKDEFLAMLAHELRNPLAPISNAVHIMKRSNLDKAQLAWCRDVIDRQVEQLVRLVDDLLDVSRISRGKIELKKEPLTLSAIVQRAVETSQPLMNARRHELSVCLPPEPVYVEGDLIRLSQCVSNLLTNAAKYTDTGGCIRLTVEQAVDDIFIRVRDNGRGITPAALPSLFQLFYQVDSNIDRSEGGLGIGLSLVKNLVAMHGGSVEAFSEGRGQGSEFVIRLPCLPESVAVPVFCQTGPKLPAEGRLRILVVDDNRDAAQSLSLLLTSEGHAVFLAYDGYTALEVALAERPQVLLLDIGLPGMDGYAVARTLQQHPDLKTAHFIAVSGYGRQVDREQARAAGFNSYLTKPVNFDELQCALAQPLFSGEIPV